MYSPHVFSNFNKEPRVKNQEPGMIRKCANPAQNGMSTALPFENEKMCQFENMPI